VGSKSEEYNKAADDCRQLAGRALTQADRERWLKIAERWVELAQRTDNLAHSDDPEK
jgi:hypothetical protein